MRTTIALWSSSAPLSLFKNGRCLSDTERRRKLLGLTKLIDHPRGTRIQISLFSILGTGGHMRKLLSGQGVWHDGVRGTDGVDPEWHHRGEHHFRAANAPGVVQRG